MCVYVYVFHLRNASIAIVRVSGRVSLHVAVLYIYIRFDVCVCVYVLGGLILTGYGIDGRHKGSPYTPAHHHHSLLFLM